MGNSSTRYLSNAETIDILGGAERWNALKATFDKIAGKSMDYRLFCSIIQRKYQNIPKALLEVLFQAFAADLSRRVDMENFLSTFAVIDSLGSGPSVARPVPNPQLLSLQRKCLFRIYEVNNSESGSASGTLQRRRVEDILRLAYGEALKPVYKDLQRQLDAIFSRYQSNEISLKEFENSNPHLEMLSGWVRTVVRCFDVNDISQSRLYALERKHSAQLDDAQLCEEYGLSPEVCSALRKIFIELCTSLANRESTSVDLSEEGDNQEETQNLSVRAELQCNAWLTLLTGGTSIPGQDTNATDVTDATDHTSVNTNTNNTNTAHPINTSNDIAYLNPVLARVIFNFKVDDFKLKWHFKDFASFCAVFGGNDVELQASTVVDAFLHDALTYYYNGIKTNDQVVDTSTDANVNSIYELNDSSSTSSSDVDESSPFSLLSPTSDDATTPTIPYTNVTSIKSIVEQTVDEFILQKLNQMITILATSATLYSTTTFTPAAVILHPSLVTALHHINNTVTPEHYSLAFTDLIITHLTHLPGMRDLMLCACCKFGLNPTSPLKEMELCTELSLRYLHKYPQSVHNPYGPVGTEWCVIPKSWYDSWKLYVGHQHHYNTHNTATNPNSSAITNTTNKRYITNTSLITNTHSPIPASIAGSVLDLDGITPFSPPSPTIPHRNSSFYGSSRNNTTTSISTHNNAVKTNTMKRFPSPNRPSSMDTTVLLKKQTYFLGTANTAIGSKQGQLLPNLGCGKDVEIVSPDVYKALISWYGGGPRISRSVVASAEATTCAMKQGSPSAIPSRPNIAYKGRTALSTQPASTMSLNSSAGGSISVSVNTIEAVVTNISNTSVVSPRVVPYTIPATTSDTNNGTSELELYPVCINIHTCNNSGKLLPTPLVAHVLFSKTATVHDICLFISCTHDLEMPRLRLWNYFHSKPEQWREQYVLSPELTLSNANIADHQILLLEVSLSDGSWPRSILQSQLDNESSVSAVDKTDVGPSDNNVPAVSSKSGVNKINFNDYAVYIDEYLGTTHNLSTTPSADTTEITPCTTGITNYDSAISGSGSISDSIVSTIENAASTLQSIIVSEVNSVLGAPLPSQNKALSASALSTTSASDTTDNNITTKPTKNTTLTTRQAIKSIQRNSGLVGLDNLGNTCYMNSSLQALLHTQPLVDYFLSQAYTRHINTTSIHGFKGQLAQAFGQLVCDAYSTTNKSLVPRTFRNSIASMHDQFSGHEQHDAQELLAFLLDGLSEDLNLVHTKPYTEQPDSDHRSDAELADIWWSNHLKRDKSVIQAMFSGQFKSTMKCTHCTYHSARYEPFNFISVPVPEESDRLLSVTVVPFLVSQSVIVSVKVSKNGTLHDVVQALLALDLVGLKGVYVGAEASGEGSSGSEGAMKNSSRSNAKDNAPHQKHKNSNSATNTDNVTVTSTTTSNNYHTSNNDTSHSNTTPYYFQAGELVNHRIKSFNTLDRPVHNIRDSDCVVLFQVRTMYGIVTGINNAESPESVSGEKATADDKTDVEAATLHNTRVNAGKSAHTVVPSTVLKLNKKDTDRISTNFDPECLYKADYSDRDQWVRVAFTQRRARLHDAALFKHTTSNSNSVEYSIVGNGLFGNTFTAVATSPNTAATNGTSAASAMNNSKDGSALHKAPRANGTEYFKLEAFGIAGLEVLPNKIRCGDLYKLVALKYSKYLKVPVRELITRRRKQRESQKQALKHTSSSQSLNSINSGASFNDGKNKHTVLGSDPNEEYPVNVRSTQVGPADSDEVLGGAIPEYGFTLRLVNGGVSPYSTCSRCPWLKKCDGCVLPDHAEVEIELRDGESVAIDWHFEVYETILDTANMCKVKKHSSSCGAGDMTQGINVTTPLARCFDKFTELEPLDDIVCPTCHNTSLSKAFTLWRLPPVLIVQLKRFRFDRTSRRKLNNQIDFPMEDLDLFDYLAPSRQRSLSRSRAATMDFNANENCHNGTNTSPLANNIHSSASNKDNAEWARTALYGDDSEPDNNNHLPVTKDATSVPPDSAEPMTNSTSINTISYTTVNNTMMSSVDKDELLCTHYDLYCVVHHAGALGGGHYATTARALNMHLPKKTTIKTATTTVNSGEKTSATSTVNNTSSSIREAEEEQWYCFNDNLVSTIDKSEICSPSAYLLFYMRKDMRQGDVLSLLRRQLSDPVIQTETPHVNVFRSVSSDIVDPKSAELKLDDNSVHSGNTAGSDDEAVGGVISQNIAGRVSPSVGDSSGIYISSTGPELTSSSESGIIAPEQVTLHTTTAASTSDGVIKTSTKNGFSGFTDGEEELAQESRNYISTSGLSNGKKNVLTGAAVVKEENDCVIS